MPTPDENSSTTSRTDLLNRLRAAYGKSHQKNGARGLGEREKASSFDFSRHGAYAEVRIAKAAAETLTLAFPFFRVSEGVRSTEVKIHGRWVTNFASYDYLSINQSEAVRTSVKDVVDEWGVSATASRLVGGERSGHSELEKALAAFVGTDSALAMVSGHATNIAAIRTLLGPGDLVVVDSLAHNSIYEGIRASGAAHVSFPHNDYDWIDEYLASHRSQYKNALIAIEGLYSMDGDAPDLARFVDVKRRYRTWLMIDEAHSIGVLGATGRGICEEQNVDPRNIELIMGTLSKSFCSCGGFVAGSDALTDLMRYKAPGFVYSVGLSTPNTAAAKAAVETIGRNPDYAKKLRTKCEKFHSIAKSLGLNIGESAGYAICPVIIGDSLKTVWCSNQLLAAGFNVLPIIAPAVPDQRARLRFFLNRDHSEDALRKVLEETARLVQASASMSIQDLTTSGHGIPKLSPCAWK